MIPMKGVKANSVSNVKAVRRTNADGLSRLGQNN